MKTVKILGMGRVAAEKHGVSRVEYFKALETVAKWHDLTPHQVDLAIQAKKELNR